MIVACFLVLGFRTLAASDLVPPPEPDPAVLKVVHPVKDDVTHDLLRAVAGEPDRVVRAQSQWAFVQIRDPEDRPLVAAGLADPEPAVREMARRAAIALGMTNVPAADTSELPVPAVAITARQLRGLDAAAAAAAVDLIRRELGADTMLVREEAARAAQRGKVVAAVPELLSLLDAEDEGLRGTVAAALAVLAPAAARPADAVAPLVRRVADDPSLRVQLAAADALVAIHGDTARQQLEALLGHDRPETRQAAVTALGQWRDPALAAPIEPLLHDPTHAVAGAAAEALGRLGNPASAAPLIARLPHASWRVQIPIAGALAALRSQAALPALTAVLHGGVDDAAAAAARALWQIGDRRAVPALRKLVIQVSFTQYHARGIVIQALHDFGDRDVMDRIYDIVTKRVVPPPPGAPLPLYDSDPNRCRALAYLRDLADAQMGDRLLNGFTEPTPAAIRPALAETLTKLTGRSYRALPDHDFVRYDVESLGGWHRAGVPPQPGVERVETTP